MTEWGWIAAVSGWTVAACVAYGWFLHASVATWSRRSLEEDRTHWKDEAQQPAALFLVGRADLVALAVEADAPDPEATGALVDGAVVPAAPLPLSWGHSRRSLQESAPCA